MKVKWISKQYSRFDLALTKLSRPLIAVNTISNLSVALIVGIWLFGALAIVGFLVILGLGYGLHRSGFFMETVIETFDQQSKNLWERQNRLMAAWISKYNQMDFENLSDEINRLEKELRL